MHVYSNLNIPPCDRLDISFRGSISVVDDEFEQSISAGLGYQLAFLWQKAMNIFFEEYSHPIINCDPSSVELFIKITELSFATGLWQSTVKEYYLLHN